MAFLVRDGACEHHPVVGIGSIGSPIMQIRERDSWIGWNPESFLEFASEEPSAALGEWIIKIVDNSIKELFLDDFIEEQLISAKDLRIPSRKVVDHLVSYGEAQRKLHHRFVRRSDLRDAAWSDGGQDEDQHWRGRACTHLYRSKRALTLADMLRARMIIQYFLGDSPTSEQVRALMCDTDGRKIVRTVLRKAKADRVGIAMADITVCGAIAPYGPILGGKLVSMLAASPEVITAYRKKYFEQESEIASSMAGRPIIRPSQLVFLGTTSLYGIGSSQYNRLRMPSELVGGRVGDRLEFVELGRSEAYGTSHFSSNTVSALVELVQQKSNGQRVNCIFGEGVSPKLRKIRQGLDALNLPTDALLRHGRKRIVYGVPLIRNIREFLLGMDNNPDFIIELNNPERGTAAIGLWWTQRWLSKRIMQDEVLSSVEKHTLVRPVRHGARVILPPVEDGQLSFFIGEVR